MSYFSIQLAPRAVAVALSFLAVSAFAQTPHNHAGMAEAKSAAAPVAAPVANVLRYESVFARYKSYRDETMGSWREANETVDRIGGWRAYAKEAQQLEPAKPNPHAGHGAKP